MVEDYKQLSRFRPATQDRDLLQHQVIAELESRRQAEEVLSQQLNSLGDVNWDMNNPAISDAYGVNHELIQELRDRIKTLEIVLVIKFGMTQEQVKELACKDKGQNNSEGTN